VRPSAASEATAGTAASAAPRARNERRFVDDIVVPFKNESDAGVAGCDAAGLGTVGWRGRTADQCGAVATRKAMMFAALPGWTACVSTSGMTRPVSGGVKKLRGPDTVRAQLKVVACLATDAPGQLVQCVRGAIDRHHREPGPCEQCRRGTAKLARTDHHRHALARAAQRSHDDLPAFDL
jgi:hypothetical protein